MDSILVFDFGTTYFKAGVIDPAGRIVALHRAPSPITSPQPGRSEMAIEAFREAVRTASRALKPSLTDVRAVTYSTQANTFTLLDAADRALTPLIVWTDARAIGLGPELARFADASFVASTGLPIISHPFSLAKLKFLAATEPQLVQGAARVSWLPDLFTHWLTGVHVTEASIAALSGLFDVSRWGWSRRACEFAGIDAQQLSTVVRAGAEIGTVCDDTARELGLPAGCRFIAGCLDQYAGALGVGNDRPRLLSETTGTVLATVACSTTFDSPQYAEIFRGPGPDEQTWFHMSFGGISGNLLEHYRQQLPDGPSIESLGASVAPVDRLRLDAGHSPDELKQTINRWAASEPRGDVVRAIFHVVADALADQVKRVAPGPAESIRSAGGAARNRAWLQMKADVLGIPVIAPATEEPTLLGAASLATKALGWCPFGSSTDDPQRLIHPRTG